MEEIWKYIPGWEGRYMISNYGRVMAAPRILKPVIDKRKYNSIELSSKKHFIHRLVALSFIPNPNNYPIVMHLDDNPSNNNVNNLKWGTQKMNIDDMIKKGRANYAKGENNYQTKLTEKQVLEIRKKYIPRKYGVYKLAKEYSVSHMVIFHIIKRNTWKHI